MAPAFLLAAAPTLACGETTLPQDFQLLCNWEYEESVDWRGPRLEFDESVTYSSSELPTKVETETFITVVEVVGLKGTRHFLMRDLGGVLAGENVTVYSDGRSVRVQNYRIGGELTVHATVGTCEVID